MFLSYVLTTLALATFVNGSVLFSLKPQGSDENQYKRRKGNDQTTVEMPRSNDGTLIPPKLPPRDDLWIPVIPNPQLEQHVENSPHESVDKSTTTTEGAEQNRNKRSYYVYQVPKFQSIGAWRASLYPAVPRQYFLPIYGVDGKKTIYLPQQQLYVQKNPIKTSHVTPSAILMIPPQSQNFGYDSEDEDRPMWDNEPVSRPKRTQKSESRTFQTSIFKDNYNSTNNINHLSANGDRRYPEIKGTKQQAQGPSKCVWAIVSCCSTSSSEVNYKCFNQLGCAGPFLDGSPCKAEVVKKAIESAMNFYSSKSRKEQPTVINVGK